MLSLLRPPASAALFILLCVREGVSVAVAGPSSPREYGKMEVDVSEVLAAIGTLYDAQVHDKQKHDQASRWLGQLQRSVSHGARALATIRQIHGGYAYFTWDWRLFRYLPPSSPG